MFDASRRLLPTCDLLPESSSAATLWLNTIERCHALLYSLCSCSLAPGRQKRFGELTVWVEILLGDVAGLHEVLPGLSMTLRDSENDLTGLDRPQQPSETQLIVSSQGPITYQVRVVEVRVNVSYTALCRAVVCSGQ